MANLSKILLVDDDIGILESMRESLKDNYCISTAKSGEEAIEIIKNENQNLVILDIRMDGIDGIETLKVIRSIDNTIPVIMVSVIDTLRTVVRSIKLGASDYFDKPFDINGLKKSIKEVMANNEYHSDKLKSENHILPMDIEQFISDSADNMSEENIRLKNALRRFSERYIDLISSKFKNEFIKYSGSH
jgi:two-component system, response regulator, stage 0 sporulation protein F